MTQQTTAEVQAGMLPLPARGDVVARRWAFAGIVAYVILGFVFVATLVSHAKSGHKGAAILHLVGLGQHMETTAATRPEEANTSANWTVFILVTSGVVLTVAGMWHVLRDVRVIGKEEEDLEWIRVHPVRAIGLVFAPANQRETMLKQGITEVAEGTTATVETLVDDRVRRVRSARLSGGAGDVSPEALRAVAEARTARHGGFARYASSLLLLMAVLGTFGGVKTALPGLVDALTNMQGGGFRPEDLTRPLDLVADAFGGNALALIGALSLGVMAQGIAFGRRHLLERLELVSDEVLYRQSDFAGTNPMAAATHALRGAAEQIRDSNGMLVSIEGALQTLGEQFKGSFSALQEQLVTIANQQREDLHNRTAQSLERLQNRVAQLADGVSANAMVYKGLVDTVQLRVSESREAVGEMKRTNDALARALGDIVSVGDESRSAVASVAASARSLSEGSAETAKQVQQVAASVVGTQELVQHLSASVGGTGEMLKQLFAAVESTSKRLEGIDERAAGTWKAAGSEFLKALSTLSAAPARSTAAPPLAGDSAALLRRIADAVEAGKSSSHKLWQLAAASAFGVLLAAALLYLFRPA